MKVLLFIGLILCWTGQTLCNDGKDGQCICNLGGPGLQGLPGERGNRGPNGAPGSRGVTGVKGESGYDGPCGRQGEQGLQGKQGDSGNPGRQGLPGPPGLPLSSDDAIEVAKQVEHHKKFATELSKMEASLMAIQQCDIHNSSWRQIAHIDVTDYDPKAKCPYNLRSIFNNKTQQMACFRSKCFALTLKTERSYSHVCGRVRGYNLGQTLARGFNTTGNINFSTHYADGVLITSGNHARHLWTYVAGKSNSDDPNNIEGNYHCEFESSKIGWENPLWDRAECVAGDKCCENRKLHGWFHTDVELTDDSIQVRWCGRGEDDIVTDILQIWVQ